MRYKNNIDELTGLPLRKEIKEYVGKLIKEKRTFHLYIIDIDYFKVINDQFGHLRGDEILKDVADLLKNGLDEDEFVGRYGGDEFILIGRGSRKVEEIPIRITEQLNLRDFPGEPPVKLSLSFGSVTYPVDGKTFVSLLKKADTKLLEKKKKRHTGIRLVGRDNIISLIKGSLLETMDGKPNFIHIIGESGVGKTRLLEEVSVIARMMGFKIIYSQCKLPGIENPINLFASPGMKNIGWKISWRLREWSKESPLLWIIEDIEYCPSEMGEVLKDVFRTVEKEPILVILSGKPDHIYPGFARIVIAPFDIKMTEVFIKTLLGIGNIDHRFVLHTYKNSNGIPSRISMIVNSYLRSGFLSIKKGRVTLKEGISLDIDQNILNKFSEFSKTEKRVFVYAALLEEIANAKDIKELTGLSEKRIERLMEKGKEIGLLDERNFRYIDETLGQAILDMYKPSKNILVKTATFLHNKKYYKQAGRIFEKAEKFEKAFNSYIEYVKDLMDKGLLVDAMDYLEGLKKWKDEKWFDVMQYHRILSDYYFRLGKYENAIKELELAYGDTKRPEYYIKKAKSLARMGKFKEAYESTNKAGETGLPFLTELLLRFGDLEEAEKVGIRAIQVIEDPEYLMEAYAALGGVMIQKGKLERALHHLHTGMTIAGNMNNTYWLGIFHNRIGVCYYLRARLSEAKEYYEKALWYFSELGDTGTLTYMYLNLGLIHMKESNIDETLKSYFKAYTISKDIQQKELQGRAARYIGELYLEIGDIEKAEKFMNEALNLLKQTKKLPDLAHLYSNLSRLYLILTRYEKAREFVQRAKGIAEKLKSPILKAETLMREGEYHLRAGNFMAGKRVLEKLRNSCPDDIKGEYYLLLARVYDTMDKPGLARKYGEKAIQHHKLHGTLWAIGKDYYVLGRLKSFSEKAGDYNALAKEIFRRCGIEKGFEDYI